MLLFLSRGRAVRLEPGQPSAEERTAILEYRLDERESRVSLRAGRRMWTAVLPAESRIEQSVAGFIRETGRITGHLEALDLAAVRIAAELIPFRREMDQLGVIRLIVIPDGILRRLPFEALRFGGARPKPLFLVEQYACSYVSPGSEGRISGEKSERRGSGILAVGIAAPGPSRADAPLPAAGKEILLLSRMFPKSRRCLYLNEAAGAVLFRRHQGERFEVVHFAGHACPEGLGPAERAALVLAPDRNGDGFLGPKEIRAAGISAELVVLSACRTACPGLAGSFLEAGARSVVAALWRVADEPTAALMAAFYAHLGSGRSKTEALREAKRDMIRRGLSHPCFWAPFVLQGDPDGTIAFR